MIINAILIFAITALSIRIQTLVHECGHALALWVAYLCTKKENEINSLKILIYPKDALLMFNGKADSAMFKFLEEKKSNHNGLIRFVALMGIAMEVLLILVCYTAIYCISNSIMAAVFAVAVNAVKLFMSIGYMLADRKLNPEQGNDLAFAIDPNTFKYAPGLKEPIKEVYASLWAANIIMPIFVIIFYHFALILAQ